MWDYMCVYLPIWYEDFLLNIFNLSNFPSFHVERRKCYTFPSLWSIFYPSSNFSCLCYLCKKLFWTTRDNSLGGVWSAKNLSHAFFHPKLSRICDKLSICSFPIILSLSIADWAAHCGSHFSTTNMTLKKIKNGAYV